MLTELAEKLAVAAAETIWLPASSHQNAEHIAFRQQRRRHERAQTTKGKPTRKRELGLPDVGLVDQTAAHALAEAVLIDPNPGLLCQCQFHGQAFAAYPDAGHGEQFRRRIIKANATEVYRQAIFQSTYNHLEDAAQVLPLPNSAGDLVQQIQASQLRL